MVQWVKNSTAMVQVTEEARVQSLARCSGLKDPALPELQPMLQLWFRFNLWPGKLSYAKITTATAPPQTKQTKRGFSFMLHPSAQRTLSLGLAPLECKENRECSW